MQSVLWSLSGFDEIFPLGAQQAQHNFRWPEHAIFDEFLFVICNGFHKFLSCIFGIITKKSQHESILFQHFLAMLTNHNWIYEHVCQHHARAETDQLDST